MSIFPAMSKLARGYSNFLELFFPILCVTCGNRLVTQEKFVCIDCWHDLPVTNFHVNNENKVAQLFWGRVKIENATAFFAYNKGSKYQHLIHFIKYKGLKELGFITGQRFGLALSKSEEFSSVDVIVPVPLHPKKQKLRGYNQSEWIANGISDTLKKPVSTGNLQRNLHTSTQTRKNRYERWENVENIFEIIRLLEKIVAGGPPHRNSPCLCGSGQKYRHCHKERVKSVFIENRAEITSDISLLKQFAVMAALAMPIIA